MSASMTLKSALGTFCSAASSLALWFQNLVVNPCHELDPRCVCGQPYMHVE